jgi:hypothetical protein
MSSKGPFARRLSEYEWKNLAPVVDHIMLVVVNFSSNSALLLTVQITLPVLATET